MSDLPKAVVAASIQEDLKKITKDLQKNDPEIPDTNNIPLASRENFKDLVKADLGKTKLSFEEELKKKVESRKIDDSTYSQTVKTEEKIDNHAKRLEELKQKEQDLESKKKELEERKANPNITREERWKIAGELAGIDNQFKSIEKETKTIQGAASREKQFNNNNNNQNKSNEPTAAEKQQQGAMEAIKRMKEAKKATETANKSTNNLVTPSGKIPIPPPPPMPGIKPPPPPPPLPMLINKGNNVSLELQKKLDSITKQMTKEGDKHRGELAKAIQNQRGKLNRDLSRGR